MAFMRQSRTRQRWCQQSLLNLSLVLSRDYGLICHYLETEDGRWHSLCDVMPTELN